jgi:hypothetical protein
VTCVQYSPDGEAAAAVFLERGDVSPAPVDIRRVRVVVAPRFFRMPGYRCYSGYAFWRTIVLKHADRRTIS